MQEAINMCKDISKDDLQNEPINMNDLKPDINNLLHMYLPNDITVGEVEILAMVINEMIWNPRRFLDAKHP